MYKVNDADQSRSTFNNIGLIHGKINPFQAVGIYDEQW